MTIDQPSLDDLLGRFVADLGATLNAAIIVIGDQLGLYMALAARPAHPGRAGRPRPAPRALRPRVARRAGCRRLRQV